MNVLSFEKTKITRRSKEDKIFDIINYVLIAVILILVIYPLYFIIIASISDPNMIHQGKVWFLPKEVTFEGYKRIFNDPKIWIGYKNSIIYTLVGTLVNISCTLTAAYALSRKDLYGKRIIMSFFLFTMFFSGGLIPTYLIVKNLGLLNTMWALILPKAVAVWNLIVAKTYFETTIPNELLESAKIDGCSDAKFFWKIVLPLSKPIVAVMVLFYAVGHWNSYFDALIYLNNEKLYPLQLILRNILIQNEASTQMIGDLDSLAAKQRVSELIKYGVIIVASIPLLIAYPFVQKYFVKGVMIGGIKG
ncbi:putative aldouronate transport system permease protein [Anoxybacillus voinovskiensis]|uniref:Putative aldouronate transport system permease protein n=1 Tax=Anoxybacteroides voinovskiense TaxID=230470 RepID=A0A840DSN8_9BACL|nr:carbohydrate ABC transporter permease [Anoxybacillus voinovskiensis]MBB4073058.1 putative aldouronate transport system permease protein [Anoxybacillus voinovskiensis]GGJ59811.1 sugar ABC transporter permease [Anoxybacillus voinovskiensis]